jgi:hypothetical protein
MTNKILIFNLYDRELAEQTFPCIDADSTDADIAGDAWTYTLGILREDPMLLSEAFVGEYLSSPYELNAYQSEVLQALADENYVAIGKLVEKAIGAVHQIAIEYIEEYVGDLYENNQYLR